MMTNTTTNKNSAFGFLDKRSCPLVGPSVGPYNAFVKFDEKMEFYKILNDLDRAGRGGRMDENSKKKMKKLLTKL